MSKPESAGESLESILASIRKSLSEQSTDVLSTGAPEEPALPYDAQGAPKAPAPAQGPADDAALAESVPAAAREEPQAATGKLRAAAEELQVAAVEPPQPETVRPAVEERLQTTDEPPLPAPATVPTAASSSRGAKDPLWFLSRRGEASEKAGERPVRTDASPVATSSGKPPASEPKLLRVGVVRGPLPPFFGSSAETAKAEAAPVPASSAGISAGHSGEPGTALNGGLNGKASTIFDHAPAANASPPAAEGPAQIQGLEAMVAELLRPMLRRWLDENMPRLVSAALKAEAELISKRDAKKP